jgi:hypothetical protein
MVVVPHAKAARRGVLDQADLVLGPAIGRVVHFVVTALRGASSVGGHGGTAAANREAAVADGPGFHPVTYTLLGRGSGPPFGSWRSFDIDGRRPKVDHESTDLGDDGYE